MFELPTFSFEEVWNEVSLVQKNVSKRCLSKTDIKNAIHLREHSVRQKVIMWGGFVPVAYKYQAFSTKLILNYDGTFSCRRDSSCTRTCGIGNEFFETGPLFGIIWSSKYPRWFPKFSNDGKILEKVSRDKLLRVMLRDRMYGNLIKQQLKT